VTSDDSILELYELDKEEDIPDEYVGRKVYWHGELSTLVRIKDGSICIPILLLCYYCEKSRRKVYMGRGLHGGAWPYAYNIYGKYLGNLRDLVYICSKCAARLGLVRKGRP
jgi:hypothetical protein